MILDGIISAACLLLSQVLAFLPSSFWGGAIGLWDTWASAWNTVEPYYAIANYWVPVNMVIAGWFGIMALRYQRILFRALVFVYRMIPIVGH